MTSLQVSQSYFLKIVATPVGGHLFTRRNKCCCIDKMSRNKCSQPPPRWLHCPRKANQLVIDKFLAFKTPLSSKYDESVPEACRWDVSWIFNHCKDHRKTMGLWIDLTNTDRFYDKQKVEHEGCK